MTKIHYDINLLKANVNTNLNDGINNLNNTNRICAGFNIPSDFSLAGDINDFSNTVKNELSNLNKAKDILNNSERYFSEVEKIVFEKINALDKYQVGLRESEIKG